jgi:hypothetical protein
MGGGTSIVDDGSVGLASDGGTSDGGPLPGGAGDDVGPAQPSTPMVRPSMASKVTSVRIFERA